MKNAKEISPGSTGQFLILGQPFTGKSTFASSFPTPGLLFDFDQQVSGAYRGKDFTYATYAQTAKGWDSFSKDLRSIDFQDYQTVVVDSTTTMQETAMQKALQINPQRCNDGPCWNIHYTIVKNLMKPTLAKIKGCGAPFVVIISHMSIQKDDNGVTYSEPLLVGDLKTTIPGEFGEVYCARTATGKNGEKRFILQTVKQGIFLARSNIKGKEDLLPDYIENEFGVLQNCIIEAQTQNQNQN